MISKETKQLFFSLLGQALWPVDNYSPGSRTNDEWEEVRALSKKHSVQGLVFDAVRTLPQDCGMMPILKAKWLAETVVMEERYDEMSAVIAKQNEVWCKAGISAILLKGHSVARFYPVPEHRSCGDIDWWFPKNSDWERANALARERGKTLSFDSDGDCHYLIGAIVVEHHRKGYQEDGIEGQLHFLNAHILRHAMVLGVGMKQICDLAAAYTCCFGQYDGAKLKSILSDRKVLGWTNLLHTMLVKTLGMPEKYLPFPLKKLRKSSDLDTLVDLIIRDGHFGRSRRDKFLPLVIRFLFFRRYCPVDIFKLYRKLIVGRLSRKNYA